MTENFPNLGREMDIQLQEAQRTPKRATPRHIITKLPNIKDKERILKAPREERIYIHENFHKTISQWELFWSEENGMIQSKY